MSSEDLIREAQDPATPPGRLAELAQADRGTWTAIVFNPSAYDGLLQWLGERGDPTVNAALQARASHAASLQPPAPSSAVPPSPAPASVTPAVAEQIAEPIAEPVAPAADHEPTAVISPEQTPEQTPEPTTVIPMQEPEPAAHVAPDPEPTFAPQPTEAHATQEPVLSADTTSSATQQQPGYAAQQAAYPSTAVFGAVPPAGTETNPAGTAGGGTGGRPLAVVVGLVVVIVLLLGGAAFGASKVFGGDDGEAPSASETRETPAPDTSDSDEDDPVPTTPEPEITEAEPGDLPASDDFCSSMKSIQDASLDVLGGAGATPDLGDIQDMAKDMVRSYQELEQTAPDELKDDVRTMASFFDSMMNPSSGGNPAGGDMAGYAEAAQRVSVYYAQNCL